MIEFTPWDIVRNLLLAARWTVALSLVAFVGGALMGVLALMMRTSRVAAMRRVSWAYIELFQGTPLLMQLFLAFFGLSLLGVEVPPWLAAGAALTLWSGAFLAEIWRGCVEAIPKGQWEASASLALGYVQQMRHVVLPQALRIAIAPTVGFAVQIVKSTALTS
ncbi:amino acid ABC transporter permease, partial [Achromobacter sp.]